MSAYERCEACHGSGIVDGFYGPVDCAECRGACVVRARDERGRFIKAMP